MGFAWDITINHWLWRIPEFINFEFFSNIVWWYANWVTKSSYFDGTNQFQNDFIQISNSSSSYVRYIVSNINEQTFTLTCYRVWNPTWTAFSTLLIW